MKQKLLLVFAVVVLVFAVLLIADQVMAGSIFLPLIQKGSANPDEGSIGPVYVFSSSGKTTGMAGGRSGMNAICATSDPTSHFCTEEEFTFASRDEGIAFSSGFSKAWLDYTNSLNNDQKNCGGWDGDTVSGLAISNNAVSIDLTPCTTLLPVACCKRSTPTLYVFSSNGTTNGQSGGRSVMADICTATDPASHFCSVAELRNAFMYKGVVFSNVFLKAWMDNMESGFSRHESNCLGWSTTAATGEALSDNAVSYDEAITCTTSLHVACCKWIP